MAAVTDKEYRRYPEEWWKGRRARLVRDIETGGGNIYPQGAVVTITRKFSGFNVTREPCKCCGVRIAIHKLHANALELIEEENGNG